MSGVRQFYLLCFVLARSYFGYFGAAKSWLRMARPALLQLFCVVRHPETHCPPLLLIVIRDAPSLLQKDIIRLLTTSSRRLRSNRRIQFNFVPPMDLPTAWPSIYGSSKQSISLSSAVIRTGKFDLRSILYSICVLGTTCIVFYRPKSRKALFALFEPPICFRTTQTLLLRELRGDWSYDARFFGQDGFHILGPCDKSANGCLKLSFQRSMFTPFLSLRLWCNFFPLDELSCQPRRVVDTCNSVCDCPVLRDISHLE